MTETAKIYEARQLVRRFVPEFDIKPKATSRFQRVLGWVMGKLGNKSYMDGFWTTIGYTTYAPSKAYERPGDWMIVLHEGRHALDAKNMGRIPLALLYLSPQILGALFLVLAPLLSWWLLLVAGACLAPVPSPGRAWLEKRAYEVSTACWGWYHGGISAGEETFLGDNLAKWFTTMDYYKMWFNPAGVRGKLGNFIATLRAGVPEKTDLYMRACKDLALAFAAEDFMAAEASKSP